MMNRLNRSGLARLTGLALMVGVLGLTGCDIDSLLEVQDRDRVTEATVQDPEHLDIVIAAGINDFARGYGGSGLTDSYLAVSAAITDEMHSSGSFPTRTATDRRLQQPVALGNTSDAAYNFLHFARRQLHDAAATVAANRGTDADFIRLKALEGYTLIALGEGFCSAVPVSFVVDGERVYGEPETSRQLLQRANALFDEALAAGASHLASVGKARALAAVGQHEQARTAVASVPTNWVHFIRYSVSGQSNPIYSLQNNGRWSLSDSEGGNGAPFRSAMDPRSPWWENPQGGFTAAIRLFVSDRHEFFDSPVALASGVEARLIEAEADFWANDYGAMTTKLNELRQNVATYMTALVPHWPDVVAGTAFNVASLPALAVPGTEAAARDMLFEERGFWLLLTGRRLGDLRRLVYQHGLSQANVYPAGVYHKGDNYGADVVFPLDFDEEGNNPNFQHSMCDVQAAGID
jgi:starch-binding outer membrane protein, SusD/RagB family